MSCKNAAHFFIIKGDAPPLQAADITSLLSDSLREP